MTPLLWPHQQLAIDATTEAINREVGFGLWVMPTGTGKTRAFCSLARQLASRSLIVVHRDELVRQTTNTLAEIWPEAAVGIVQGSNDDWRDKQVVVATVQSLHRRLSAIPPDHFGLLVLDEAHHSTADSWRAVWTHFRPRFRLGVTATPERLDGRGLAEAFGPEPIFSYGLRQAIDDSYLVPIRQYAIKTEVDLDRVVVRGGDFAEGDLAKAVMTAGRTRAIVEAYLQHAADRKAIVFAVDLDHVDQLRQAFADAGVSAASVTGTMDSDDRRRVLAEFREGTVRVLVGCEVLTEGYDERTIDCVIMARPTQSRGLYQQCVGRGLRLSTETGKVDCLVLDVTDNCRKHKLVAAPSLFGSDLRDAGGREVRAAIAAEGERRRRQSPRPPDSPLIWRLEQVSPWSPPDLARYKPLSKWEYDPATDKQLRHLRRFGFAVSRPLTKGEASHLIDQCQRLEEQRPIPPTPSQVWFLKDRGRWHPDMTKREAQRLIGQIKKQDRGRP